MSGASIGASFKIPFRHTDQPVWRGSYDVDDQRAQVVRPIGNGTQKGALDFIETLIEGMERWALETREPVRGHRLTANMIWLMKRLLRRCTDFETGRCEPTIETIQRLSGFSRPTVIRLLARARTFGFVEWVRRTVCTGNKPGDGPMVAQTSNAYFFEVTKMPVEVQRFLKQKLPAECVPEHPARHGSGRVPGKFQRKARQLLRGLTGAFSSPRKGHGPAEMKAMDARLAAAPPCEWPAIVFPNDPDAQAEYALVLGLAPAPSASCEMSPESPP